MRKNQKYTQEEMYMAIELWKESGQTQAQYCKANNVSRNTFKYWIGKYHRENLDGKKSKKQGESFLPIEISAPPQPTTVPAESGVITIGYPGGTCVTCPMNISIPHLLALVKQQ